MDHIIFNINQTVFLHKNKFPNGYVFTEEPLSIQWRTDKHSHVTNRVIDFILLVITNPRDQFETTLLYSIAVTVLESMFVGSPWPLTTHDPRTFD